MLRPRKSHFGSLGLKPPVRLDEICRGTGRSKSPLGSGLSPNPIRLGATLPTPRLGSSCKRRVKPVRESDVKELTFLYSSMKKQVCANNRRSKTPSSRRCLYEDLAKQTPGIQHKAERNMQGSSKKAETSKIPRASISTRQPSSKSTVACKRPSKPNPPVLPHVSKRLPEKSNRSLSRPQVSSVPHSGPLNHSNLPQQDLPHQIKSFVEEQKKMLEENQTIITMQKKMLEENQTIIAMQKKMLEEANSLIEQQKNMLVDAKGAFSSVLHDQRCTLRDMQSILADLPKLKTEDSTYTDHEFTELERQFNGNLHLVEGTASPKVTANQKIEPASKENSSPKSAAAYRDMRKSFGCLHTPILGTNRPKTSKAKTPRSLKLSAKVKAQLEELLD